MDGEDDALCLEIPPPEVLQHRVMHSPPTYGKPREVGCYSVNGRGELVHDRSALVCYHSSCLLTSVVSCSSQKVYQPRSDFLKHANLRIGLDQWVPKDEGRPMHLHQLLEVGARSGIVLTDYDVVTWRGVMTRLLCSPFLRDTWTMTICLLDKVMYVAEERAAERLSAHQRRLVFGGHKFETLCMVSPGEGEKSMEARQQTVVNTKCEFDILFRTQLGSHRLLLGAEVDGLDEGGQEYIELKTTACIRTEQQQRRFINEKCLKWWVQSFLAGVPTILVGHRDERLWIERLERLSVERIPRMVRGQARWDPNSVLAFGELLLSWLRHVVASLAVGSGGPEYFTLEYDPARFGSHVRLRRGGRQFMAPPSGGP